MKENSHDNQNDKSSEGVSSLINNFNKLDEKEKLEWFKTIYASHYDRFSKDTDKIWSIGGIFIPLSLVGLTSLKDLSAPHTCLIAFGSIMLMLFWTLIANRHRKFTDRSYSVITEIEQSIGFKKVDDIKTSASIQNMRWGMFVIILFVWTGVAALAIKDADSKSDEITKEVKVYYNIANKTFEVKLPISLDTIKTTGSTPLTP